MASHQAALKTVFTEMREPWWNEDIVEDNDTDTDRRIEAESRRKRQGADYKTFPNQAFIEVLFMMLHGFGLVFVPCYLTISVTLIGWVSSVESITQNDQAVNQPIFEQTLVGDGSYNMMYIGVTYWAYSIYLLILSILTIKATFLGEAWFIKFYLFWNFVGFLSVEILLFLLARFLAPMNSCQLDLFQTSLEFHMSWYGLINVPKLVNDVDSGQIKPRFFGYEAVLKMNSIQQALGCCGIHGYDDYRQISDNISWFPLEALNASYGIRTDVHALHRELDSVPHTCCKPVWQENIYCAEEIYYNPNIQLRISENGCYAEAQKICENLLYIINITTLRIILLRILFFMFALWLLHYILQMLAWEKIQAFEALLDMQRPNLQGFDLADAISKLKPITSQTQALPGQKLSAEKLKRMASASSEDSESGTGLSQPTQKKTESVWDEQARKDKQRLYMNKTKEQLEKFSGMLKTELGAIPADLDLEEASKHKLPHLHHHGHHHHHHHHHHRPDKSNSEAALVRDDKDGEPEVDSGRPPLDQAEIKPSFRTVSTAIGRIAFSRVYKQNKVHPSATAGRTPAQSKLAYRTETETKTKIAKPQVALPVTSRPFEPKREHWDEMGAAANFDAIHHREEIEAGAEFYESDHDKEFQSDEGETVYDADEEETEYDTDEWEEDFRVRDRHRYHRYDQHVPEDAHPKPVERPTEDVHVLYDRHAAEEKAKLEKIRALAVHTSEFGEDRFSLITTESTTKIPPPVVPAEGGIPTEPQSHAGKKRRKKKKKTGLKKKVMSKPKKKSRPKKAQVQDAKSWDSLWWTGH